MLAGSSDGLRAKDDVGDGDVSLGGEERSDGDVERTGEVAEPVCAWFSASVLPVDQASPWYVGVLGDVALSEAGSLAKGSQAWTEVAVIHGVTLWPIVRAVGAARRFPGCLVHGGGRAALGRLAARAVRSFYSSCLVRLTSLVGGCSVPLV